MWNPTIKAKVLSLRRKGYTYSEIRNQIPRLPKGTLSGWCGEIILTEKQERAIITRATDRLERARIAAGKTKRKQRAEREGNIHNAALTEFYKKKSDPLFMMGIILYWAEGSKTGESFQFMNSDSRLVLLMVRWLMSVCSIPKEFIKIRLYAHKIYAHEEPEKYWQTVLSFLPKENFKKTVYKKTPHRIKRNPDYRGCLRVEVGRVDLLRKVKYYFELVSKEYSLN